MPRFGFVSKPGEGGQGLGLSIALRIAKLHGAELTAESRLGDGALHRPLSEEWRTRNPGDGARFKRRSRSVALVS